MFRQFKVIPVIIVLLMFLPSVLPGYQQNNKEKVLIQTDKTKILKWICDELSKYYINPDIASKMEKFVLDEFENENMKKSPMFRNLHKLYPVI